MSEEENATNETGEVLLGDRPLTPEESRHCCALQSLFTGLLEEYPKALRRGRVKAWCATMRSIADFYDNP